MLDIHASAIQNFNTKALALVGLLKLHIEPFPNQEASQINPTGIPIGAHITETDIIGDVDFSTTDYHGRPIERMFPFQGKQVGLQQADYAQLIELAKAIHRLPPVREQLSLRFIEETLFHWVQAKFLGASSADFISHLSAEAKSSVSQVTVYVPIANTIVREPFRFGGADFVNLSSQIVNEMLTTVDEMPLKHQAKARKLVEDFRKEHQGRAAVMLLLECEKHHAFDIATDISDRLTALLSIYSACVHIPDIKCTSRIKGSEHIESAIALIRKADQKWELRQQNLDTASSRPLVIDSTWLANARSAGLDTLSALYIKTNPNEFEQVVLNMASLYARAAFTKNPLEKLVHCLSAIESTFLKTESEPIQQNIGERMAMFTRGKIEERKEVIRNLKAVYSLRSRYLHHGHSTADLKELEGFYMNTWILFVQLLSNVDRFKSKEELLSFIDDMKFKYTG
jgi:hypothetical protein